MSDIFYTEEALFDKLTAALNNHELKAYYQPQYDAVTGRLVSAEALVRWRRADGRMASPAEFIPFAEESDLILRIDWYMLNEVCRFLKKRRDEKHRCVPVAVNFSRKHILEPDFRKILCQTVDSYGLPRELIEIEITESALMNDSYAMIALVTAIREDGFNVAIDDFGSGLSSLSLVKDLPANVLKIDRSLLSGNCENEKERIVLEAIFNFAHRLKLTTIAEGVETEEQLGFLRTCDCRLIQGFLYAKPMPEDEFGAACSARVVDTYDADILSTQPQASATALLMEAIFMKYPLVIMANLTRNSFYMLSYDNFSSTSCPSTGKFNELIDHGASTMHPDDQQYFHDTFQVDNLMRIYNSGVKSFHIVTRQLGDDGIYRRVETNDFFVKNPSVDDVLVITLCQNLED